MNHKRVETGGVRQVEVHGTLAQDEDVHGAKKGGGALPDHRVGPNPVINSSGIALLGPIEIQGAINKRQTGIRRIASLSRFGDSGHEGNTVVIRSDRGKLVAALKQKKGEGLQRQPGLGWKEGDRMAPRAHRWATLRGRENAPSAEEEVKRSLRRI
jgi:hypothetical protein